MNHAQMAVATGWDWRIVALSYVVAVLASYTALDIAGRVTGARGQARIAWLAGGAFAMGIGIWSMHFTGMQAFKMPMLITYDVPITLLSMAIAIAASGLALFVVSRRTMGIRALLIAGPVMGIGIASMHYTGMAAMQMAATISYDPTLFILSVLIAIGASVAALWLAFRFRGDSAENRWWPWLKGISALVMGLAIVGMHYTGMAAANFVRTDEGIGGTSSGINTLALGFGIGFATLLILGIALVSSIVDRKFSVQAAELEKTERRYESLFRHNLDGVYSLDLEGTFLSANGATEKITGYRVEELRHRRFADLAVDEDSERVSDYSEMAARGEARNYEIAITNKEGRRVELNVTSIPIVVADEVVGIFGIAKDITERKRAEKAQQARLASIVENSSDAIDSQTLEGAIISLNPGAQRLYGYSEEELKGKDVSILTPPDRLDEVKEVLETVGQGKTIAEYETVRLSKDGRHIPISLTVSPVKDQAGNIVGASGIARDITERKNAEEALRKSEERYRLVAQATNEVIWDNDLATNRQVWDGATEAMLGYSREEMGDTAEWWEDHIHPDDRKRVLANTEAVLSDGREAWVEEYRFRRADGAYATLVDRAYLVCDVEGRPVRMLGSIMDISERKRIEKQLKHQAFHDPLTDLPNRLLFLDRLGQALRRTKRKKRCRVAILFMDLINFKSINDSLGHEAGDKLLVAVSERLKGCLRPEDTLARFGGDEFTVLLEAAEGPDEPVRVAERIIDELEIPFLLEDRELYAGVSIGIAIGEDHTKDPLDLLRDADTAMYRAKDENSGYAVFDPAMHERALMRLEAENALRRAIEREEFVVHYQPIVGLQTGEVSAVEALVRWEHPERGLLNPSEFVPLAEDSGLVIPMGEQVLREACLRVKKWQTERPHVPPLVIAVNLSARQLSRPYLVRTVERVLWETGMEGSCLCLDVTETVYVEVLERNSAAFERLRALGVRISIDDFGTGYSSLSYLKRLPADTIKIDKSFVSGLGDNVGDTAIVGTVVELAHTLGMEVIAEGVEREEQVALLQEMGCDFGQGFYFAKPLPPEEIPVLLSSESYA